jgi:hypothetical protein
VTLQEIVRAAADELLAEANAGMPMAGHDLVGWCRGLAGAAAPDAYFLHPKAFPTIRLPWWAEESLGFTGDLALQRDAAASTIAGYYFIRLLDDAMDERSERALRLLPTAGFLHHAFEAPYRARFAPEHAFWALFRRVWSQSAEASALDAAPGEVSWERFCRVSAQKVCAALIPVAAVFHHRAGTDPPEAWATLVQRLARAHQLDNDLVDWGRDLARGGSTYFLSEGRRRGATAEDMGLWVADEGYAWGDGLLRKWSAELQDSARRLGSGGLTVWLAERDRALVARSEQARDGLAAVARLLRVAGRPAWKRAVPLPRR